MGRLFLIMGKSSTGKDSIYQKLLQKKELELKTVVQYTTRPIRDGEQDGKDYHYVSMEQMEAMRREGKILEIRSYPTVFGDWFYFTADDGQIDFLGPDMLMIGTLEAFNLLKSHYLDKEIVPIYIEVEDGIRLQRALDREKHQSHPKYDELCRRFLADKEDFSEDKLKSAGITQIFNNNDVEQTTEAIAEYIKG